LFKSKAFTLIELLVVIAIIAILAASFCRHCRGKGEGASNFLLEQYEAKGLGAQMYAE